jgi:putative ABC transport system substrate-binding protein
MRRRDFISFLGGAAAAWPLAARAQQQVLPMVGVLSSASPGSPGVPVRSFQRGLSEAGYLEGRNVAIEYRWAEGQYERLPALAADLVRRQASVIVALGGIPSAAAAKAATTAIPIVFNAGVDPVTAGLAASLNRPGGNVTGVASLSVEVGPKRLQLLHEAAPAATTIALLVNPANPNLETISRDLLAAARALGLQTHVLQASTDPDLVAVAATLGQLHVDALMFGNDPFFTSRSDQLAALALRHKLPAIYQYREFTDAGGLMSYGPSITDVYRQVGIYTGRILRGEKPNDLPIQQITKLDLIFNLKTAKMLGLQISANLLALADEVIE